MKGRLAVVPMAASIIPLSLAAPRLVDRCGLRIVTALGLAPLLAACLPLANIGTERSWQFLASVLLLGASLGICVTPATIAILQSVPDGKKGVASAVNDATREVGTAIGIEDPRRFVGGCGVARAPHPPNRARE